MVTTSITSSSAFRSLEDQLCVCGGVDAPWRPRGSSTLVEVGQTLVLLADGRRGGGTQDVGEGAPGGAVLGQQPGLLALQEGRQGLPEGEEEEGMKSCSLARSLSTLLSNRAARGARDKG